MKSASPKNIVTVCSAMTPAERIKEDYRAQVQNLFSGYPDVLGIFNRLWQEKRYREVYIRVYEAICKHDIVLSPEQKYTDERFYWEVGNC